MKILNKQQSWHNSTVLLAPFTAFSEKHEKYKYKEELKKGKTI